MPELQETYTYRAGRKVALKKATDQFVVRALPDQVEDRLGIADAEQVSSASSRVTTRAMDLEPLMSRSRNLATTSIQRPGISAMMAANRRGNR